MSWPVNKFPVGTAERHLRLSITITNTSQKRVLPWHTHTLCAYFLFYFGNLIKFSYQICSMKKKVSSRTWVIYDTQLEDENEIQLKIIFSLISLRMQRNESYLSQNLFPLLPILGHIFICSHSTTQALHVWLICVPSAENPFKLPSRGTVMLNLLFLGQNWVKI